MMLGKKGRYEVYQPISRDEVSRFDFDAEEWTYSWIVKCDKQVLVLREDLNQSSASFSFQEFSSPVTIRFVPED